MKDEEKKYVMNDGARMDNMMTKGKQCTAESHEHPGTTNYHMQMTI